MGLADVIDGPPHQCRGLRVEGSRGNAGTERTAASSDPPLSDGRNAWSMGQPFPVTQNHSVLLGLVSDLVLLCDE